MAVVVAVAALFPENGSLVAVVALAVSEIVVPPPTPGATLTTSVNVAGNPLPRLASVAETVPVPPAAGLPVFHARQNPPDKLNKPGGGG